MERHNRLWSGESMVRVWYDGGSSPIVRNMAEWGVLPSQGVLLVKGPTNSSECRLHRGMDYYWWEDGKVMSCRRADLDRYLERSCGVCSVKFGRWGSVDIFQRALRESSQWP